MMHGMGKGPWIHLEDRVCAPTRPPQTVLRDAFFHDVGRLTLGLVQGERWRLRLGPITLIAFGEPTFEAGSWTWPITGGWLARQPGGSLSYGWRDGQLVGLLHGYQPRLPWPLYSAAQRPVHRVVTRRFLLGLRGRTPSPGVPAGTVQRMASAGLDFLLCLGMTALVRPRRRKGSLPGSLMTAGAVTSVYHVSCWLLGGRTVGAVVTGQRLVSVDGGRVAPWQALLRLTTWPVALWLRRAAHDEMAATEVVEA